MRSLRTLETCVLGYTIDRVDERDHLGAIRATWYEVLCPERGNVLGSCANRADAERVVIRRELELARRALPLNAPVMAA